MKVVTTYIVLDNRNVHVHLFETLSGFWFIESASIITDEPRLLKITADEAQEYINNTIRSL